MIVRIMGEGQVRLADEHMARLNELDDALLAAVGGADEAAFRLTFNALLDAVRAVGEPVPDDSLEPSDLILPARDSSLDEVRSLLTDDGLIPN